MTNVYFIQVEYDSDGGSSRENTYNYVICGYELELVESALERPYFKYYFTIETKHLVARNITEKQLEKFNLSNSWEILTEMTYWQLYDIDPIELNFEKCHMCENCGINMTERNTRFLVEEDEETVLCVDCF